MSGGAGVAAVLLALGSALAYGLSDFVGGLVSRGASPWAVALVGQLGGAACTLPLVAVDPGSPTAHDLVLAVLAGVGSGVGTGFLYRGFASGRMAVVAPVSAVGAAIVPVVAGVGLGERPALLVWLGVLLALPAIWLVSSEPAADPADGGRAPLAAGLVDGVLAGLGFGLLFALLGQVDGDAGFVPLLVVQLVSMPAVVVLASRLRADWRPTRTALPALACGPLGTAATLLFLLAAQEGFLTVAGVLSSLYPASTVLLAAVVLHERVHRTQGLGLALCAAAVVCVTLG